MSPELPSKIQPKTEYYLRLNYLQIVLNESRRVQGNTIDTQEVSQLLPNKSPKQFNQYNNWKIGGTIISTESFSKNQLRAEFNVRLN